MKKLIAAGIAIALGGCMQDSEFALPVGGGAGRSFMDQWQGRSVPSRSAPAQTQPNLTGTAGVMAVREQHGAVNQSNCYDMEARFKREGRRVRLVGVRPNDIGTGGVLAWICEFEDDGSGQADSGYYEPRY